MEMLTTKQAAIELQTSDDIVLRLVQEKAIPATQFRPRGWYRIRLDDLQRYAQERGITLLRELRTSQ